MELFDRRIHEVPRRASASRGKRDVIRGRVMIFTAAIMATTLVGCQASSVADTSNSVDSTALLQAQLDALQPGGTLTLDHKVYPHSGVLTVRVANVTIDGGYGATLKATNDETSAVEVLADGVTVTNLTLAAPTEGKRWYAEQQHQLVVKGDHDTVSHVNVDGSAGAGIYLTGAQNFAVHDVSITGTRADGLHITGGSAYGRVDGVKTDQTGDDGVAVVSYDHDPGPCHDITETDISVASTRWGRGITVVGGNNVQISNFSIAKTSSAGLYVANEGNPFFTRSVDHVEISDGSINGANWNPDIGQGSILVYTGNPGRHVGDVTIANVTVSATTPSANRNVGIVDETDGGAAAMNGISFPGIHLRNTSLPPFYTNVDAGSYSISNWTLDGNPIAVDAN